MKVLVYGAGNIGLLYAALLKASGQDVSVLARGDRLAQIREHGIRLEDFVSGRRIDSPVDAVETLHPDDAYDLVLVVPSQKPRARGVAGLGRKPELASDYVFWQQRRGP